MRSDDDYPGYRFCIAVTVVWLAYALFFAETKHARSRRLAKERVDAIAVTRSRE